MKLSIIIPCYNSETYIRECIDSVLANDIEDYEIILVNDGSTDSTLDILKIYENNHDHIRVVNKKNGGLSDARNAGIKVAKGEYITFLDSDDTVEPDTYKKVIEEINQDNVDLITFGVKMVYPDHIQNVDTGCTTTDDVKSIMPYIYPAACNKAFKKEIFDKVLFKKGVYYEDVEFIYRALPYIKSIISIDGYYYNYYQREGSITYTYNKKIYDMLDNLDSIVDYYKEHDLLDEYHDEIEYAYVRYSYATFLRRLAKTKDKKEYNKGVKEAMSRVVKNFPNYKNNKYLSSSKKGMYLKYFNNIFATLVYLHDKNKTN